MPQKPSKSGRSTKPTAKAKALEEQEVEEEVVLGSKPSGKSGAMTEVLVTSSATLPMSSA